MMTTEKMIEGPEAFQRFDKAMRTMLAVPRSELERREAAYRKQAEANPSKRGPKRKAKPAASPGSAV